MAKYGVDGFPEILFIDPDGKVKSKLVGYLPPNDFAQGMDKARPST